MMDIPRYEDFNFPYQALPNQPTNPVTDQYNASQPVDGFDQSPSSMAMRQPHPVSARVQPIAFHADHQQHDGDTSDYILNRNSPIANSLEGSIADELGLPPTSLPDGTDLGGGKFKEDKTDSAPAWTELKTKAGKERKRLPLACIACRRKKIRCSGEKPTCKHCLRSRTPCVYKVTTRKAAPRTDYMAMLDKRLKRMEERIIKIIPKSEQQEATASVTRAVVKPSIPNAPTPSKNGSKKRGPDEAFGPDLTSWASAPATIKVAGKDGSNSLQVQEEEENRLLHEGSDALPSKEVQEHLSEVFFENIYGQSYYLLHKPSYMRKLKNNTLPPVLILSVCAIAARFSSSPQLNSTTPHFLRGEEWASHARDICIKRYDSPNITILTCLVILGLHEFGTCQGGRSWALGGQAIRMAFALQLHKDLEYDPMGRNGNRTRLSFIDREIRRRIMWGCFLMDRFNSSGTDRPMFIREETVQVPLPIKERCFLLDMPAPTETLDGRVCYPAQLDDGEPADARENMGVAAFMVRAIAIWGQIIMYLNQGGREMDPHAMWAPESQYTKLVSDAESFESTLPQLLRYSPENIEIHKTEHRAGQFFFLHICIQQNVLFLNRAATYPSIARSEDGAPQGFLSGASRRMVTAANRISDVLKDADRLRQVISAPFAGYAVFSSTTVHILGLVSTDRSVKGMAERNIAINVKYLHTMKKYWGMFHWMVENVRAQYRNALDAARSSKRVHGTAITQPSMLQYADWFNRYPHGLSDAEFMDPASTEEKDKGADAVLEGKPELQSVGEYISTLSPSQNSENKTRPPKRRSIPKTQSGPIDQQRHQQPEAMLTPEFGGQTSLNQLGSGSQQQQQHTYSGQGVIQTTDSMGFDTITAAQSQPQTYNASMSPTSPSTGAFSHHMQVPQLFPPELLAINFGQQMNDPLLSTFGDYSMDMTAPVVDGSNILGGVDWDNIANGARARRDSARVGTTGQTSGYLNGGGHYRGREPSSAWFMPFNLEPPEMPQDTGFNANNVDLFAGMFNDDRSGLGISSNTVGRPQPGGP
ncbi:fungal-specific transcription factor domain-containing protein [Mariannaea sp. PMI_226]|nr:fungal-specific transcription factor domain-containing protein [Mariannaea sp. PMI_226]